MGVCVCLWCGCGVSVYVLCVCVSLEAIFRFRTTCPVPMFLLFHTFLTKPLLRGLYIRKDLFQVQLLMLSAELWK